MRSRGLFTCTPVSSAVPQRAGTGNGAPKACTSESVEGFWDEFRTRRSARHPAPTTFLCRVNFLPSCGSCGSRPGPTTPSPGAGVQGTCGLSPRAQPAGDGFESAGVSPCRGGSPADPESRRQCGVRGGARVRMRVRACDVLLPGALPADVLGRKFQPGDGISGSPRRRRPPFGSLHSSRV